MSGEVPAEGGRHGVLGHGVQAGEHHRVVGAVAHHRGGQHEVLERQPGKYLISKYFYETKYIFEIQTR